MLLQRNIINYFVSECFTHKLLLDIIHYMSIWLCPVKCNQIITQWETVIQFLHFFIKRKMLSLLMRQQFYLSDKLSYSKHIPCAYVTCWLTTVTYLLIVHQSCWNLVLLWHTHNTQIVSYRYQLCFWLLWSKKICGGDDPYDIQSSCLCCIIFGTLLTGKIFSA